MDLHKKVQQMPLLMRGELETMASLFFIKKWSLKGLNSFITQMLYTVRKFLLHETFKGGSL
jgi:hypothetical protein